MLQKINPIQLTRESFGKLDCWLVRTPHTELLIAEQGAQILRYQRHGEAPLIWLSEAAAGEPGKPVRGGVPVCWPWFGDLERNPPEIRNAVKHPDTASAHGFARQNLWTLKQVEADQDSVSLTFEFSTRENPQPAWPHQARLQLQVVVDERLHLALTTENLGPQPLPLTQALHTYFAIGEIGQIRIHGLDGSPYVDSLQDWQRFEQEGAIQFSAETDRIHLDVPEQLSIEDPAWQRRICLQTRGSHSAIVWNPWIDKAARLSQFPDDAWQRMLCIETANVLDDMRVVAPGASTSLGVSLWAEPLPAS